MKHIIRKLRRGSLKNRHIALVVWSLITAGIGLIIVHISALTFVAYVLLVLLFGLE